MPESSIQVTSHSRFLIIKKRPFGLFLFCHSLRKKFTDSFCGHIVTVIEKPFGAFDDEPETVAMMDKYLEENGYVNDFTAERRHHEIYLSDPRKVQPEKCKTVIRHPIKRD